MLTAEVCAVRPMELGGGGLVFSLTDGTLLVFQGMEAMMITMAIMMAMDLGQIDLEEVR